MKTKVVIGLLAGVGVLLSQYAPFFGGFEKLWQPWSPDRQSLIGIHVPALGVLGAVTGPALAWLTSNSNKR